MRTIQDKTVMHSYPGMVALVTVSHNGEDNIMAAGWHSYISYEPPIYGVAIGRERHTHHLVKQAGEFAINFLPAQYAGFIQESGVYSGLDINKLKHGGMGFERGRKTNAPILKDAYVAYECTTIDVNSYGDHDWFAAGITAFYRDDELFNEKGLPDFDKLSIPLYLGRSQYAIMDGSTEIEEHVVKEKK
ncbi:flavin reductase family protein [Bacillus salacetis]|uniref:Flavin reductase family protein n=1 Tax=Bacillus salacetis TaxID=2315464 RepID=A0A3A1R068_9BACI|nr:flavin reductase family protein [Bacillus salacetis]RIW32269.1 flavin reductase family protein [Bacillus salacetis]